MNSDSVGVRAGSATQRGDVTAKLVLCFKRLISEGKLPPGSKLPPERELAQRFGVSRSSLRQALKVMDIMGVLSQRVGDGTYLSASASAILDVPMDFLVLLDGVSPHELMEARLIVEPELAARAAERATAEDVATLRDSLKKMTEHTSDHLKMIELDLAFHRAIFQASGNRMCERIFTLIHRAVSTSIQLTSQLVDWEHTLSFHRPIYLAIEKRRPEEARRRMIEHLTDAKELLIRASAKAATGNLLEAIQPLSARTRRPR